MSTGAPSTPRTVTADVLTAFCIRALRACGVNEADAKTTADVLVTTDTFGVFTHGTKMLKGYVRRLQGGGFRTDVAPQIDREGLAWAIVDGNSTLGMVAGTFAMNVAIEKAAASGIGYVGVHNASHFGAAGSYALMAANRGMIGLAMANDHPTVAAPGSRRAVTGSNPLAYAIPAGKEPTIFLDMAISTVAGGKVYAAWMLGKPIPDHWIIGPDGRPTNDASLFPNNASLAPMAGHKGYGLALLIESLASLLSGAEMTFNVRNWIQSDPSLPTGHGLAFIAINVGAMSPIDTFKKRVDDLIQEIHTAPVAEGSERIYVPGEMEWARRSDALKNGIALPADVVANHDALATELNLPPLAASQTPDPS